MATDQTRTVGDDAPDDPADLLPEESILSLNEYLDMHAAVGHRTRYEILYRLVHSGEMSPKELEDVLGIDDSTLHYHLNELRDVGLVEKRVRTGRDRDGPYAHYRSTILGNVILEDGVEDLIRRERDVREAYDSGSDGD